MYKNYKVTYTIYNNLSYKDIKKTETAIFKNVLKKAILEYMIGEREKISILNIKIDAIMEV
ncbi:hypothetical protein M0Q39_06190 [Patescibacteria group bacterium]|nr:hypothetical protein [Patescibacteria group bacterium]